MSSAFAAEGSVTYTYAGDAIGYWGKSKSEIYDAAIRIQDPALVGKKVTAIRAIIHPDAGVEATSLWLTKELKLEKIDGVKYNVPDTYSADVEVAKTTVAGLEGTFGELSVKLDTPYVLTEEGIYAGYSLTVPELAAGEEFTPGQASPILLSASDNPNSLYLRAQKDFVNWQAYNSKLGAAAMIYVTLEGDFPEYSVDLQGLTPMYAAVNEDFSVKATVANTGLSDVSQIGYSYTIGGKEYQDVVELDAPIASNFINVTSSEVTLPIRYVEATGEYPLDLTVTTVNGNPNVSAANTGSANITVLPFVPVHRPMLEEFTGTWCGWCSRGYIAMEVFGELFGDKVTLAAYHNGDYMATPKYPVPVTSFPNATFNRAYMCDPYNGTGGANAGFQMKQEVMDSMEQLAGAAIEATAVWADDAKTRIRVTTQSKFLESEANADYKVGYLLINDGLHGTGTGWVQANYYNDYGNALDGTILEVLTTWPRYVPNLDFNDVVVDITGMMGVEGSLPVDVVTNTPYESTFEFDITDNVVIQDKDKLYAAAFIINPDGSIVNSIRVKVDTGNGVGSVSADAEEVSAEYYTLSGMRVSSPRSGAYVKVARMSDGTVRSSKVMIR